MRSRAFRGDRLRQLREQHHLNQQELGLHIGCGPNQIGRYEKGEADPSPYQLKRLATALQVTTDFLLGLTDQPTVPLTENSLTVEERRFLAALRQGKVTALRQLLDETLPQEQHQPQVTGVDVTPNSDPLKAT